MLDGLLRPIRISQFFFREWRAKATLAREPLKQPCIHDPTLVDAYDRCGELGGDLVPTYHFNAQALSALVPKGGTLLDLGCGSGRMLIHLAKSRPDIRLIGLDQSNGMIKLGHASIQSENLRGRIELVKGSMLKAHEIVNEKLDLISCVLSAHCLSNESAMQQWLQALRVLKFRNNCSIWIFDFARPKTAESCKFFPRFFGEKASSGVQTHLGNAMRASFTREELAEKLDAIGIGPFAHYLSGPMPFFQIHRLRAEKHHEITESFWCHQPLPKMALSHYKTLKAQFPKSILR